jgi:DNA-binding IclR family transcriptional regulator
VSEFRGSEKQVEIMTLVVEAAARGRHLTVNELMDQLSYKPARSALHCSLKFLRNHGYLETVNHGRSGANVCPTAAGMTTFKGGTGFP